MASLDSVLFTPKMSAIPSYGNIRGPLEMRLPIVKTFAEAESAANGQMLRAFSAGS